MDECDVSAAAAAKFLKADIDKAREQKTGRGTLICIDCGYYIEPLRKKAAPGCTRCIICQKEWERYRHGNY